MLPASFFILLTVAWTYAIVCGPDYCSKVQCSETIESCRKLNKEFRPNATLCGCCPACVDYIPVGGTCGMQVVGSPVGGGNQPVEQHCEPGSSCVNNVCVRQHIRRKHDALQHSRFVKKVE